MLTLTASFHPRVHTLLVDIDSFEEPSAIVVLIDIQAHPRNKKYDDED